MVWVESEISLTGFYLFALPPACGSLLKAVEPLEG